VGGGVTDSFLSSWSVISIRKASLGSSFLSSAVSLVTIPHSLLYLPPKERNEYTPRKRQRHTCIRQKHTDTHGQLVVPAPERKFSTHICIRQKHPINLSETRAESPTSKKAEPSSRLNLEYRLNPK